MKDDSKISFLVKAGGRSEPYSVDFIMEHGRMFVYCNCPAGRFAKFCKHKIKLIQSNDDILYDQYDRKQQRELGKIHDWFQQSEFLDLIFERSKFKKELYEAQQRLEAVRKRMRPVEKRMAQAMKDGVKQRSET